MKKIWLLLLLFCSSAQAELEFKIFTLQHRFASDLIQIVEPLVSPDGTVTGMNNQLIVRANSARMREVEAIVSELDVARVNRKISVNSNQSLQTKQESTEAKGNVKLGKVTVANHKRSAPNTASVEVARNSTNSTQHAQQFIHLLDGERAFIRVGQVIPYTQEWVTITRRYVQVERTTDWLEISTGFAVRPRTIGNQVELEITPRIAKLNSNQVIDFEELTTTIRLSLGQWIDIGNTMQQKDEVSRKILGVKSLKSNENSALSVKVD